MTAYQPRFIAYARTQGLAPDAVHARDRHNLSAFIGWVTRQWTAFYAEVGTVPINEKHARFDAWLDARTA